MGNILGFGAGATGFLADCFMKHKSTSEQYILNKVGNVFSEPKNIIPVLWCVSQIQYGRVDIEFWANTIGAEMAVEYLYGGKGELVSLE